MVQRHLVAKFYVKNLATIYRTVSKMVANYEFRYTRVCILTLQVHFPVVEPDGNTLKRLLVSGKKMGQPADLAGIYTHTYTHTHAHTQSMHGGKHTYTHKSVHALNRGKLAVGFRLPRLSLRWLILK